MSMISDGKDLDGVRGIAAPDVVHVAPDKTFCDDTFCRHERGGLPSFVGKARLGPPGKEIVSKLVEEALGKGG